MWSVQRKVLLIWLTVTATVSLVVCANGPNLDEKQIEAINLHNEAVGESRLSALTFALVEHFKQPDPIGLPGIPVPDPMSIPDIKKSLPMANLHMKNVKAFGLSNFRIKYTKLDVNALNVNAGVQVDQMIVVGNYSLSALLSTRSGPFTVILKNVFTQGNASLGVEIDGKIRTQTINMDIVFSDMSMDFQNLGFMGAIFQSFVNSASNLVFDAMKPFMLNEAYSKIQTEIDGNIDKFVDFVLPNSISPLDMAIAEGRKKIRQMGYDPFHVQDYNQTVGVFSMRTSNTWIQGVSSFHRVGNITVSMENNTASVGTQIGTQKIHGSTQWEIVVGGGMVTRSGQASFTLQHMKVSTKVEQSLDVRNSPKIKDLQMELGNIQVRCDGAGTLDYVIEFAINILPNLLRYQIMDAIENPVKTRIQEEMNKIDVERVIREKLPEFEKLGLKMDFEFKF